MPTTNGAGSQGQGYHPYFDHYFSQPLPPPELRPIIDKTAEYVARNSEDFERTVLERHIGDARFSFLNPWDQYHPYYQAVKQHSRAHLQHHQEQQQQQQQGGSLPSVEVLPPGAVAASVEKRNLQKLSSSGAVSFKLKGKRTSASTKALHVPPCSEFGVEEGLEDVEDPFETSQERQRSPRSPPSPSPPPMKKQRQLENGGSSEDDDIGRSVQVKVGQRTLWLFEISDPYRLSWRL